MIEFPVGGGCQVPHPPTHHAPTSQAMFNLLSGINLQITRNKQRIEVVYIFFLVIGVTKQVPKKMSDYAFTILNLRRVQNKCS